MKESFDKAFSDRFAEVFSEHQESYRPEDWQRLRQKMADREAKSLWQIPKLFKGLFLLLPVFLLTCVGIINLGEQDRAALPNPILIKSSEMEQKEREKDTANKPKLDKEGEQVRVYPSMLFSNILAEEGLRNEVTQALFAPPSPPSTKPEWGGESPLKSQKIGLVTKPSSRSAAVAPIEKTRKAHLTLAPVAMNSPKPSKQEIPPAPEPSEKAVGKIAWGLAAESSLAQIQNTGMSSGFMLGFGGEARLRLSPKWQVSTGLFLQNYQINLASKGDEPALSLFGAQQNRELIEGNWQMLMLELPLMLEYEIPLAKSRKIRLGAGLSAIYQLRENSQNRFRETFYSLKTTNNQAYLFVPKTSDLVEQQSQDLVGFSGGNFLHLSLAYEQKIGEKLGLSFAPFFRYGLASVGSQDFRLNTQGVKLGLRWLK